MSTRHKSTRRRPHETRARDDDDQMLARYHVTIPTRSTTTYMAGHDQRKEHTCGRTDGRTLYMYFLIISYRTPFRSHADKTSNFVDLFIMCVTVSVCDLDWNRTRKTLRVFILLP